MKKLTSKCGRCISKHLFTCAIILLLIVIGPIVIAVDLTFLTEWISSLRMGDFYTYLTFIGIVSVWSIYGLITTAMKSVSGITVYMIGLIFITVVHFLIGFIHIMLLYTTYRPILMDSCLQRQPVRFFWWSLGYEDNEEMKRIYATCSSQWTNFATERFVSWIVYSFISFFCLYFVVRYQRFMTYQRNKAQGIVTGSTDGDWSDDGEDYSYLVDEKKRVPSTDKVTYYHEEFPATKSEDSELSANMHQQRQKLFDEIAKRKRARSNLNRRPIISNPSEEAITVVHPLDLAQDPEVYEPPPMPPVDVDANESWNRYNDELLKEEQEALERQKRVDSLSTERLEYEMFRSRQSSRSQETSASEVVRKEASRRKRPSTARWSACFSDTSTELQPLTSLRQEYKPIEGNTEQDQNQEYEQGEEHKQGEHQHGDYQHGDYQHGDYQHGDYQHGEQGEYQHSDYQYGEQGEYQHGEQDEYQHGEQGEYQHGEQDEYRRGEQYEEHEEDNYEDYQQEDHLPEDVSPSESYLMKPDKEETM